MICPVRRTPNPWLRTTGSQVQLLHGAPHTFWTGDGIGIRAGLSTVYVHAVLWGQDYAMANRREMMRLTLDSLKSELPHFVTTKEAINCHHNYISIENHFCERVFLTRKGVKAWEPCGSGA